MSTPQILMEDYGRHNANWEATRKRLELEGQHEDHSTIIILPGFAQIPMRVAMGLWGLMMPANQRVFRMATLNMEVGAAYSSCIEQILAHPELSKWKYILTIEHDNIPEPDGLLKLYQSIEGKIDGNIYDCVSGVYFTKGEGGVAQIWGDPNVHPRNFQPQVPIPDKIVPCNGTGMGFALWRVDMFKDPSLRKPWFKTEQSYVPGEGAKSFTQDLYFWDDATGKGKKCAVDCRVRVGHLDVETGVLW